MSDVISGMISSFDQFVYQIDKQKQRLSNNNPESFSDENNFINRISVFKTKEEAELIVMKILTTDEINKLDLPEQEKYKEKLKLRDILIKSISVEDNVKKEAQKVIK